MEPEVINNTKTKMNACSLVSFIFSMIGIFIAGLPCGIIALITGIIGIVTFKKDIEKCKWMGITGLVIGIIEIVIMILYFFVNIAGLINA